MMSHDVAVQPEPSFATKSNGKNWEKKFDGPYGHLNFESKAVSLHPTQRSSSNKFSNIFL